MSFEKAEGYLTERGFKDRIIVPKLSSATVELAAQAVGVEPGRIAKTLSFLVNGEPVLILAEGTSRIDNRKFRAQFHTKAKMIPPAEVEGYVGHEPGGVCPFGINDGVRVYLDESLRRYDTVYPAAGNDHSAVKLTIAELEAVSNAEGWVDVCRERPASDPEAHTEEEVQSGRNS